MGRFANKYISNINKSIETNRNQVGWEMRTKDNLGEFRYKNDQFELVYDDKSVLVLNAGGIVITETYVVESSSSYTINAGDNIIFNSTNNINMTSVENINITSGDTINIISEETVNINSTENITFTSDDSVLTWDGDRLTTDTETVAYLTDLPIIDANTTIQGNTFNGINQLVQLDGSALINDSNISSNITKQGNTFNGVSQLVQLDGSTRLPAVDGSLLTNLPITGGITQNVNLSLQPTDEGTVPGNARGVNAIDLQTSRSAATQVASGANSINVSTKDSTVSGVSSLNIGDGNGITASYGKTIGYGLNIVNKPYGCLIGNSMNAYNHAEIKLSGNGYKGEVCFLMGDCIAKNSTSTFSFGRSGYGGSTTQFIIPQAYYFVGTIEIVGAKEHPSTGGQLFRKKYAYIAYQDVATSTIIEKQFIELTDFSYTADTVAATLNRTYSAGVGYATFSVTDSSGVTDDVWYTISLNGIYHKNY